MHEYPNGPLKYTAGRDGSRDTCLYDPQNATYDQYGYCLYENSAWMRFEDVKIFLANRGAQHWGDRSEVIRAEIHDAGLSMNVFGQVYITQMLMQCRSQEHLPQNLCQSGNCNDRDLAFWEGFAGFQWYDTGREFSPNHLARYTYIPMTRLSIFAAFAYWIRPTIDEMTVKPNNEYDHDREPYCDE